MTDPHFSREDPRVSSTARPKISIGDFLHANHRYKLLFAGAAVALLVTAGVFVMLIVWSVAPESQEDEARVACREAVQDSFNLPSSAVFADETAREFGENNWSITSTVETRNDAGETEVKSYTCIFSGGKVLNARLNI